MKKLMILTAVAAVASCARAASYTWCATTPLFVPGQTENYLPSGTSAYLFDAAQVSQANLLGIVLAAQVDWTKMAISGTEAKTTGDVTSIGETGFSRADQTTGTKWKAYFALVYTKGNASHLYVSELVDATAFATGAMNITFQQSGTNSKNMWKADSFSGPGWYAIPEPTSGLLLLLGVAGLALKRRRAA